MATFDDGQAAAHSSREYSLPKNVIETFFGAASNPDSNSVKALTLPELRELYASLPMRIDEFGEEEIILKVHNMSTKSEAQNALADYFAVYKRLWEDANTATNARGEATIPNYLGSTFCALMKDNIDDATVSRLCESRTSAKKRKRDSPPNGNVRKRKGQRELTPTDITNSIKRADANHNLTELGKHLVADWMWTSRRKDLTPPEIQIAKTYAMLYKTWGYRTDPNGDHTGYEAATHMQKPWGRQLQYYTDPLFRNLQQIDAYHQGHISNSDVIDLYKESFVTYGNGEGNRALATTFMRKYFRENPNAFHMMIRLSENADSDVTNAFRSLVISAKVLLLIAAGRWQDADDLRGRFVEEVAAADDSDDDSNEGNSYGLTSRASFG